ncbi:MAG: 3-phosphoglycerate dehydrogenase [Anaerovoracaceae bacterium]|jgi:D-3-phosphoglycerate dehydrogenase
MYNIATLNKISPVGLAHLTDNYQVVDDTDSASGILVRSQDMHDMKFGSDLLAIARAGAGVNNIPLDECADQGIVVFNTPGANANAVKELVIAGMLLAARNLPGALTWVSGLDTDVLKKVEKGKKQFAGTEIAGKTLGVIGLGAIGAKVCNAAQALGMNVIGYDAFLNDQMKASLNDGIKIASSQDEVLAAADYLSIHIPANDATKGTMNKDFFAKMKDGAVVLNFSRDKLVNSTDLLAALESGKVGTYVTDFGTDDILNKPNVICIPHLGASTAEAEDNCATIAVEEIMNFIENGNVINSVNFPRTDLGPSDGEGTRIAVITKDVADPVAAVKSALSGIDIKNIAGGDRNGHGYVLVQAGSKVGDVPSIDGAVRVRVL